MGERARPLEIGLGMPTFEAYIDGGGVPRWDELLRFAQRAEELGYDALWMADHLIVEGDPPHDRVGFWDAWSLLGALAASTTTIRLGPYVACAGFRNPALIAKMADTLDEISGGRLILGLGAGYVDFEYEAFGFPTDHKVGRFEEALAIIHGLLRDGRVDFEGRYHSARECELRPRGPSPGGPPLLVGGVAIAPRMLGLTVRYADMWTAWSINRVEEVLPLRDAVDAACRAVGRDPATLGRTVTVLADMPGSTAPTPFAASLRSAYSEPATGSVQELADLFRGLAREGISHAIVYVQPTGVDGVEAFAEVLELLDRG
jgi:alkanesulfonate monooxygenase SsuD/methylene tetrahydromethanopterin reductase-like flavin-dependent oxidoreductase (luciferase family)